MTRSTHESRFRRAATLLAVVMLRWAAPQAAEVEPAKTPAVASSKVDFAKDIRPIFAKSCYSCHGPDKQQADLRLDVKAVAFAGGTGGRAIIPGKSGESKLAQFVAGNPEEMRMPAKGEKLTAAEIGLIRTWIDQGAEWPDGLDPANYRDHRNHWAFKPLEKPSPPEVKRRDWVRNRVDQFILARLEKAGLTGGPESDKVALIRRVFLDLTGLPPSPEEAAQFAADDSPGAYAQLVDRLLDSPRYGEMWARHWLDVVRFAESNGFETNTPRRNAWPYRDYVIRAFNEDKPYRQFILEQLAGDTFGVDEATGFIVGGPWDEVKSPDINLTTQQRMDELHDMVSTTGSAFLGLTVGCARCHNHKFDPISQVDYYSMQAVFAGVQHGDRPLRGVDAPARLAKAEALKGRLAQIDNALDQYEPAAFGGCSLLLDDEYAGKGETEGPRATALIPPTAKAAHVGGEGKGALDDPGDATRLPNVGRGYSAWNNAAGKNVFAWEPREEGRFQVWVSWGAGYSTHAKDARYILDEDGDLGTTGDQKEIARVDQRFQAGEPGAGTPPSQALWSGFFNAGTHSLKSGSKIVLRGGDTADYVTADVLAIQEEVPGATGSGQTNPSLRNAVQARSNVERFAATSARRLRFVILETNSSEPCIDELEVYSDEATPRNVALRSNGTKATASGVYPNSDIHKLEHINDGLTGNSHSWISNESGKGWVELEFPQTVGISKVVWGRDREERYADRLAIQYRIEVSEDGKQWRQVAGSGDRQPFVPGAKARPVLALAGRTAADAAKARGLQAEKKQIQATVKELTAMPSVYAGRFEKMPGPSHRLHRGEALQKREQVAPGALKRFGTKLELATDTPEQERRLALAKWIIDEKNPLTARVMVNRIWQYHFGQGIVGTPSDFGLNGAAPTHPELLDWLASEFVQGRWSMKNIHRLILLSATYRQSSQPRPEGLATDAGCSLLWRFPPRRLEAEPLRDAILAVSGNLQLKMGGPGFDLFEPNDNYVRVFNSRKEFGQTEWRRMIYLTKHRMQLDDVFGSFDCPDAGQIAPKRNSSITALQALNLLNSSFILQQSQMFADRLKREAGEDAGAEIERAFQLIFSRRPTDTEREASLKLLREHGLAAFCRGLFNANEFVFLF